MTERHFNHDTSKKEMVIDVDVDLPDKVILELALMAHKRDITLNELCIEILEERIDEIHNSCSHDEVDETDDGTFCTECGKEIEII